MNETEEKIPPIHPGEVLLEEFLRPMGISSYRLAKEAGMPLTRVRAIIHGKRGISAETALRLSRYFGTTAKMWMNLQVSYDLDMELDRLGSRLLDEVKPLRAA
jgi:addiction module HigA family antidote